MTGGIYLQMQIIQRQMSVTACAAEEVHYSSVGREEAQWWALETLPRGLGGPSVFSAGYTYAYTSRCYHHSPSDHS